MQRLVQKNQNKARRTRRVKSQIYGTADRPRLAVHISNKHVSGQIIDDSNSTTLISANSMQSSLKDATLTQKADAVGQDLAKKAKSKKIISVVFDRRSKLYHGRVKALADAARKGGLKF